MVLGVGKGVLVLKTTCIFSHTLSPSHPHTLTDELKLSDLSRTEWSCLPVHYHGNLNIKLSKYKLGSRNKRIESRPFEENIVDDEIDWLQLGGVRGCGLESYPGNPGDGDAGRKVHSDEQVLVLCGVRSRFQTGIWEWVSDITHTHILHTPIRTNKSRF